MDVEDFFPSLEYVIENTSKMERFVAIARVDDLYNGRAKVNFVTQKNLAEYEFTPKIIDACNFYSIDEAKYFMKTRLRTAIAKRNKLITNFVILELIVSISGVLE